MLEKLAVHNELWIKMLVNMGCNVELAKDLVQDMYIRLNDLVKEPKKIMYGEDVNRYYIWVTLRNMYFSHLRKSKSRLMYRLLDNDDIVQQEYDESEDDAFETLSKKINKVVSYWKVYDKRLFELYFINGLSLRAISKGSKIGLTSIHNSVLNYKEILRESFSEDIEDYFNQDFDKI